MPISLKFLIITILIPALSLSAQQSEIVDPTTESPEMKAKFDKIRGVEQMEMLRKQFNELTSQNQQLMQKLLQATEKIDAMQGEMNALREGQERAASRRSALPDLRMVSQLRTGSVKQAQVSVAGRTYSISDGRPFRLQLSNEDVLLVSPTFQEDGAIRLKIDELSIEDLDAGLLLSFMPSPPPPPKPDSSSNDEDDN